MRADVLSNRHGEGVWAQYRVEWECSQEALFFSSSLCGAKNQGKTQCSFSKLHRHVDSSDPYPAGQIERLTLVHQRRGQVGS